MPRVENPLGSSSSSGTILNNVTNFTATQLTRLNSTPVTLVPAPGAGLLIIPVTFAFLYHFGTQKYAQVTGGNQDFVEWTIGLGATCFTLPSNFITSTISGAVVSACVVGSPLTIFTGIENQPILYVGGSNYNGGPIVTATLAAGGTGYVVNDTGTITSGANNATYIVTSIGAGGAVTGFTVTAPGTRCGVANGVATATGGAQPGVGTGFTVNITAVTTGDGTLRSIVYYQIASVT